MCDNWKDFNKKLIPLYLEKNPNKSKIAAGLSCGMLWTVGKGLEVGDIVISPTGNGEYLVGEIIGNYFYEDNAILPHRRKVKWFSHKILRGEMSLALRHSIGSIGTCCDITKYGTELERLIEVGNSCETGVENVEEFAMESHLEDFLIQNWKHTPFGKKYDIYEEGGILVGQQYSCNEMGRIDILAISKDRKTLLVIELKKGRTSDVVVGQILRYMGYVKEELSEPGQSVRGIIIGLELDSKLKKALIMTNNIEFYRYQIDFKQHKDS